jgi:hypothetical protein
MTMHIDPETGWPDCERCVTRWWSLDTKPANPAAWFEQLHVTEGHR